MVPHRPQTLIPSSRSTTPSAQIAPLAGLAWCFTPRTHVPSSRSTTPSAQMTPPAGPAWCLTPRKLLFLRPEAPRPQPKLLRRRGRRGASPPANPYSFVRKHHAHGANGSVGGVGVVPHRPQTLIPSSGSTTPSGQMPPPVRPAWCLTARKSLFLRPEAPRPQAKTPRQWAEPLQLYLPRSGGASTALSPKVRAEPLHFPPPPKTGQVPAAGLPQTQPAQFMEMK